MRDDGNRFSARMLVGVMVTVVMVAKSWVATDAAPEPYVLGVALPDSQASELDIRGLDRFLIGAVEVSSKEHDVVIVSAGQHYIQWGRKRHGYYGFADSVQLIPGHRYEVRVEEAHVFGGGHYGFPWIEDLTTHFVVSGMKLPKLRSPEQERTAGFRSPEQAEFFAAAASGDTAGLKRALTLGALASGERDWKRTTILMYAAREAQAGTMRLLIEHGADLNARNRDLKTALHFAAEANSSNDRAIRDRAPYAVRLLLEHAAEVNPLDASGMTPLEWGGTRGPVYSMLREAGGKTAKQMRKEE